MKHQSRSEQDFLDSREWIKSMNQLEQLRQYSVVVADTGDISAIQNYRPTDATTNPTLLLDAAAQAQYHALLEEALRYGRSQAADEQGRLQAAMDKLAVNIGAEILRIIPGRVSTEVDARLSFNANASIAKARQLIALYQQMQVPRERILIKLASTWEGIQAARVLEAEGIHCNMTLLFSLAQAVACAEAGVKLISPFVGRIYDWYCQHEGVDDFPIEQDPGVLSVNRIYQYFKKFGYQTEIMGASFRKKAQVLELAGCDLLTISPKLLEDLRAEQGRVVAKLNLQMAALSDMQRMSLNEPDFRWLLNEDAMATEKLAEGIRKFAADARKLEINLRQRLAD